MFSVADFLLSLPPVPIVAYGAYWAFNIRRALAINVYRQQALGAGLAGLGFMIVFAVNPFANALGTNFGPLPFLLVYLVVGSTFFWIDASVRTARRSDPLLRETFHWRKLRFVLWGLIAIAALSVSVLIVFNPSPANSSGPPPLPFFLFALSPLFVVGISGLVILPRAAGRSGDIRIRRQLRWFGLFVFFGLFNYLVVNWIAGGLLNEVLSTLGFVVSGFCLYRSARSLVPLNKISLLD